MGTVYRVWDVKRNAPLAMKVLHTDLASDPSVYKRFRREAKALEDLAHPLYRSFL
jgi:serine/threonine protein kinase